MPVVTVNPNHYEREELKTAPADPNIEGDEQGFIMVRPLPYGMKLSRRDKASKMSMEVAARRGRGKRAEEEQQKLDLETLSEAANAFDFAYCIGDHNLLDAQGNKLDFSNPMSLKLLDPKVGSEIENILTKYNEDEDEESLEDFTKRVTSSTQEEDTTSVLS
jgi:hypothetical protein